VGVGLDGEGGAVSDELYVQAEHSGDCTVGFKTPGDGIVYVELQESTSPELVLFVHGPLPAGGKRERLARIAVPMAVVRAALAAGGLVVQAVRT
jgi:hypothetical protein